MPKDHEMSPSDAELTAQIRTSQSSQAVDELYRRHKPAVLSYALACCRDPHTAEDLMSEAFTRTLQAVRSGGGPEAAWRPYLLTVVRRTAADWAGTERRTELSPDFEQWLERGSHVPDEESGEERILRLEDNSLVLRAFRSLPERWQAVLWYTAVEEEPSARVGVLLGVSASGVNSLASRAKEGLREAYLTAHVEGGSDTDECRHYSSLLGAAVRRVGRRTNKDLERHLASCERCRGALLELTYLNERLGSVLPAGVLLWGGSAYVAARLAEAGASAGGALAPGVLQGSLPHDGGTGLWTWAKGAPLASGAVAGSIVAAVGLGVLVTPWGGGRDDREALPSVVQHEPTMTIFEPQTPVTLTATPSAGTSSAKPERKPRPAGKAPAEPGVPKPAPNGLTPLHLRADQNLGSPQSPSGSVPLSSPEGRNYDGTPHEQLTFVANGVSGSYDGGSTRFDLFVDAGEYIANGPQMRISYDLTGNGTWDRVETYRYFETDDAPGYEHYTDFRGLKSSSGSLGDMVQGKIKVEVWSAIGPGSNTLGVGDTSLVWIPFG
ncbi:sigma-70 family RNA polymerase sigma factor [Streptomyces sp. NPDC051776]|uniref:sigma-70 family RNA polymerase sigma factor n=1 Tax=Streptomyces sp. NPDC051776 TaxID=3155414 RepID=UPI0034259964